MRLGLLAAGQVAGKVVFTGTEGPLKDGEHPRAGEWAKSGLLSAVSPSRRVRETIEDTAWKAFTYQGKTWGYPIAIEANGLIYNKALVTTPPATFEDVVRLDNALMAKGKKAILWDFNKSFFTWPRWSGRARCPRVRAMRR